MYVSLYSYPDLHTHLIFEAVKNSHSLRMWTTWAHVRWPTPSPYLAGPEQTQDRVSCSLGSAESISSPLEKLICETQRIRQIAQRQVLDLKSCEKLELDSVKLCVNEVGKKVWSVPSRFCEGLQCTDREKKRWLAWTNGEKCHTALLSTDISFSSFLGDSSVFSLHLLFILSSMRGFCSLQSNFSPDTEHLACQFHLNDPSLFDSKLLS